VLVRQPSEDAGERVFRGVDRWAAGDYHRQRLRALGLVGYCLHDTPGAIGQSGWPVLVLRLT
jgi:hypothetical protein